MFEEIYGRPAEVASHAPGRVNLIGEHTDYSGGLVLPMATPQQTRVFLALRHDAQVSAHTMAIAPPGDRATFELGEEALQGSWVDYVQGVTVALRGAGLSLRGFDAHVESEVPSGSGLSSSAALSVALLRALRAALHLPLDDLQIALLGQRAETDFVGAPVGVMDPMAASLGDATSALFIDTRTLSYERIPFPSTGALVVIDSGISHANAGPDYRARRAECERATRLLGVTRLGELRPSEIPDMDALPEPLGRRVRHVVTENERVRAAVTALRRSDLESLGELFCASHASMRDDFEVSLPDIDRLVNLACGMPGAFGARMTGGGFGGCVIALVRRGDEQATGERIVRDYRAATGRSGALVIPRAGAGLTP